MKKVLFTMMAALLVCGMSFAQPMLVKQGKVGEIKGGNFDNDTKTGWVGNYDLEYVYTLVDGAAVYLAPKFFDSSITGQQITKIKFYVANFNSDGVDYNSGNFTLEIYDNITLTELSGYEGYGYYNDVTDTPVYTQAIDVTADVPEQSGYVATAIVDLEDPYTIPEGDFYIGIKAVGNCCVAIASGGETGEWYGRIDFSQYGLGWLWVTNESSDGSYHLAMQVMVDDGSVYEESADIEAWFGSSAPGTSPSAITVKSIGETEDLVVYPYYSNHGPDALNTSWSVVCSATINGQVIELLNEPNEDFSEDELPNGYYVYYSTDGFTITVDEIAACGDVSEFTVTTTVEAVGDPNPDNNTATLLVTIIHLNPVENLVATPEGSNVVLTWDAPSRALNGYLIYRDGVQIGMKPASTTTYTDANVADGQYTYCVKARYGEGDSEEVCVDATVDGINSINAENVAVYPNPASNYIKVANAEGANISIINNIGQVVANINNANAEQEINVSTFANGIYTLRIANNDSVVTTQFSVSK